MISKLIENIDETPTEESEVVYRDPHEYSFQESQYVDRAMLSWLLEWFQSGLEKYKECIEQGDKFTAKVMLKHLYRVIDKVEKRTDKINRENTSGKMIDPEIADHLSELLSTALREDAALRHDLQTALNCMKSFILQMQEQEVDPARVLEIAKQMEYSIRLLGEASEEVKARYYDQMVMIFETWIYAVLDMHRMGVKPGASELYSFMLAVIRGDYRALGSGIVPDIPIRQVKGRIAAEA